MKEIIRKTMGWCPNAEFAIKSEEINMVSYERKYIDKIKGMGFRGFLGILNLVFGAWLIFTALQVLAKPMIFPWWFMDINLFSSGILLLVGLSSIMIFLNFVKAGNVHRILALINIVLLVTFLIYLGQFMVSSEFSYSVFDKPYMGYSFGPVTLVLFTFIITIPSALTFFNKPSGERNKRFLMAILLVLMITFASVGVYYLYLNKQKDAALTAELGDKSEIKLYKIEPGSTSYYDDAHPYFLDSPGDTTGHHISLDSFQAIQFLQKRDTGKVLSWWDYELEIKAAGKEPVISYASKAIKSTIARPASLYDKFEPDEKVADVSMFFTTSSEDVAKGIAEKYGANSVYLPKQRINDLIEVMMFAANPALMQKPGSISRADNFDETIKPTMANKFITGADLKYFDKVFENKDVIMYELK
jgi:hypothetical protein